MNEKPVAGLLATVAVLPLLLLCCLGPVILGSILGGIAGWLSGLGFAGILSAALAIAAISYGILRWRQRQRLNRGVAQEWDPFGIGCPDGRCAVGGPEQSELSAGRKPKPMEPQGNARGNRDPLATASTSSQSPSSR